MPQSFISWVWLVPFLPALSALLMLLAGRRLSRPAVSWLCCGTVFLSFLVSIGVFLSLVRLPSGDRVQEVPLFTWIPSMPLLSEAGTEGSFQVAWAYLVDPLSVLMLLVVSGVGFVIHVYSVGYMAHEGGYYRYFGYLNLFMFMMLNLVLANNIVLMFVGWEGVGLCSYLLIGFWFLRRSAADAGKKAFVVNRVGDAGFLLGLFFVATTFGTVYFVELEQKIAAGLFAPGDWAVTAITFLLFLGATGKSAQIPLYIWLPDAMEGPTPVSALIHAATMVTAGVYMIARLSDLYLLAPWTMAVVAGVGAVTAVYAASMALVQFDIKRVLAYSTISQLGYMFLALGAGAFAAGIFHLMTHAFFKALLFLGAGSVIHALAGRQDMREMGGLKEKLPITYWTFLAATLAIAGAPFFSGFFSKDEILWRTFASPSLPRASLWWFVGVVTAGLTAFYMFRLFILTFHGRPSYDEDTAHHIHESPRVMAVPLIILAVLSVGGGWVGIPALLGEPVGISNLVEHFLAPVFAPLIGLMEAQEVHYSHAFEGILMLLSVVVAFIGFIAAYVFYVKRPEIPLYLRQRFDFLYRLLYHKYYVDELYSKVFVEGPVLGKSSGTALARFDLQVIDGVGVDGSAWFTRLTSRLSIWWDTWVVDGLVNLVGWVVWILNWPARALQTGLVQRYALWMVTGMILLLFYYVQRYILGPG